MARYGGELLAWRDTSGGDPIESFAPFGKVAGIGVGKVGGYNGPGPAYVRISDDLQGVGWKAPKAKEWGPYQTMTQASEIVRGVDPDAYIIVQPNAERVGRVNVARFDLVTLHNNGGHTTDITAAEASSGVVKTDQLHLANTSTNLLENVKVWIDPLTPYVELAYLGGFSRPVDEEQAITIGTIAAGAEAAISVRRTIPAGSAVNRGVLMRLHASFDDNEGGRAYSSLDGLYRILNDALYRFYTKQNAAPVPGVDPVAETAAALPHTLTQNFNETPGEWFIGTTYFDGLGESPINIQRLETQDNNALPNRPGVPVSVRLQQTAGGAALLTADHIPGLEYYGDADTWAVWVTTDGTAPDPTKVPTHTEPMRYGAGFAHLRYAIAAQSAGTVINALVRARRQNDSIDSRNTAVASLTVDLTPPPTPPAGQVWGATI